MRDYGRIENIDDNEDLKDVVKKCKSLGHRMHARTIGRPGSANSSTEYVCYACGFMYTKVKNLRGY